MKIGVLGAGSWGTALAVLLHENGHEVTLWSIDKREVAMIDENGNRWRSCRVSESRTGSL